MFISRLRKLNRLANYSAKFKSYYSIKINKFISSLFSTTLEKHIDKTENLSRPHKFNTGEYLTVHYTKFPKIELIISNLDKYYFKKIDEEFYALLMILHNNLLFISKTQCRKIPSLYSTIDRVRFRIFEFNNLQENFVTLSQAKGILYFIYVLEKKNIYNITREENNSIMPKILKFMEENHKIMEIADLVEIIQILCHFGLAFNLKLVEQRIMEEIKHVNFSKLNHVLKNLRDSKNSKLNYFKTILLKLILHHLTELALKENLNNRLSFISNLTNLCLDLPTFEAYNEICEIIQAIQREFLINEDPFFKLNSNSILNLFETINNLHKIQKEYPNDSEIKHILVSKDFVNIINRAYDHISTTMIYIENFSRTKTQIDKLKINKNQNNFFNLPLLLLLIKHVSSLESHLLPKEDHLKVYFRYIKNNLANCENVHREALFCYQLMERTSCSDSDLAELLRVYLINHIHLIDAEKYPLRYFTDSFKTSYKNDHRRYKENVLKPLTDNFCSLLNFSQSNHRAIFYFKLFINSCSILGSDHESQDISDKLFRDFLKLLGGNNREETVKESCKVLEYFVKNKENFNSKYEDAFNYTLISILDENMDKFLFLDLLSTKFMVFMDHLCIKNDSKNFLKRHALIGHILDSKYKFVDKNFKILNEFRMLAENNIIIHPNSLIRVISYMKDKKIDIKEDQLENLMKLIFIILKKLKFQNLELQKLNISAINDLLLLVNLKSLPSTSIKINIFSTLEIASKIMKHDKQIDYNKFNRIFSELKLLSIKIHKPIN